MVTVAAYTGSVQWSQHGRLVPSRVALSLAHPRPSVLLPPPSDREPPSSIPSPLPTGLFALRWNEHFSVASVTLQFVLPFVGDLTTKLGDRLDNDEVGVRDVDVGRRPQF